MFDPITFLGVSFAGGFSFRPVLEKVGKGAFEDLAKDFFKDQIEGLKSGALRLWQETQGRPPLPEDLQKVAGKAVAAFLQVFEEELKASIDLSAALPAYTEALETFLGNTAVRGILAAPFETPDQPIDYHRLSTIWVDYRFPVLPEEFEWEDAARQYGKKIKALMREEQTLKLFFLEFEKHAEEQRRALGVLPGFDTAKYAEMLRREFGQLKLDVLHTSAYDYRIALWKVFVPQSVREDIPHLEMAKDYLLRQALDAGQDEKANLLLRAANRAMAMQPALSVLAAPDALRIALLGDPGSGKSALAQFVALSWANDPAPDTPVPLLIELRKYVADRNAPKSFLEYFQLGASCIWHFDQRSLDERLTSGGAIVIFDGLDEVIEPASRETVLTEILRFSTEYPKTRIVVTSRSVEYQADRLSGGGFRHFTIQDFDDGQIRDFAARWHAVAYQSPADRERYSERLLRAIGNSRSIRELAGNPLLLTTMAILNHSQELPRGRAELYEQSSRVLLQEWDINKALSEHNERVPRDLIGHREKQEMLRKLAFAMQTSHSGMAGNLIAKADLERLLSEYLRSKEVPQPIAAANYLIQQLRARNFILCFAGAEQFSFVHRTFLEYFCAAEIVWRFKEARALSIDDLISKYFLAHWADETWREVLRLVSGMIYAEFAGQAIGALLKQEDLEQQLRPELLAAECLSEVSDRSKIPEIASKVRQALEDIVAIDLRFPFSFSAMFEEKIGEQLAAAFRHRNRNIFSDFRRQESRILQSREKAVRLLAELWPGDAAVGACLRQEAFRFASTTKSAIQELARGWKKDPETLAHLKALAQINHPTAIEELSRGWPDDPEVTEIITRKAESERTPSALEFGYNRLADHLSAFQTEQDSLYKQAIHMTMVEKIAAEAKTRPESLAQLMLKAQSEEDANVRKFARYFLKWNWKNDPEIAAFLRQPPAPPT